MWNLGGEELADGGKKLGGATAQNQDKAKTRERAGQWKTRGVGSGGQAWNSQNRCQDATVTSQRILTRPGARGPEGKGIREVTAGFRTKS